MTERWKEIPELGGVYLVSTTGRVIFTGKEKEDTLGRRMVFQPREMVLTPKSRESGGHLTVGLTNPEGVKKSYSVHRLVAEAFIPNPDNKPQVLHWDDNPLNNNVSNLRWGTQKDNMQDRLRNGNDPNRRKTHCSNGHEFSEENTRITNAGKRWCRVCDRLRGSEGRRVPWRGLN